jgi:hypothetical protein
VLLQRFFYVFKGSLSIHTYDSRARSLILG